MDVVQGISLRDVPSPIGDTGLEGTEVVALLKQLVSQGAVVQQTLAELVRQGAVAQKTMTDGELDAVK